MLEIFQNWTTCDICKYLSVVLSTWLSSHSFLLIVGVVVVDFSRSIVFVEKVFHFTPYQLSCTTVVSMRIEEGGRKRLHSHQ